MDKYVNGKKLPFWKRRPEYDLPLNCLIAVTLGVSVAADIKHGNFDFFDVWFGFAAICTLVWMVRDVQEIRRQLKETKQKELKEKQSQDAV